MTTKEYLPVQRLKEGYCDECPCLWNMNINYFICSALKIAVSKHRAPPNCPLVKAEEIKKECRYCLHTESTVEDSICNTCDKDNDKWEKSK